ncbi:MAG: hypothetical protein IOD01_13055 [Rhodobacter sp.]|nr:hypothetical protein [Rhodobacter sp.]
MNLTPEAQILIINAVILGVAYVGIYPSFKTIALTKVAVADCVLSGLSLLVAGALFWGTGVEFSMLLFSTNWFGFSILTMLLMELPLFHWFCQKRGLKPFEIDED